jgi:aspartyl-tRNA(Asn)/glutamyl-tRNA(Gln) amidotransferase subunit C
MSNVLGAEDVERVARLARLELTAEETVRFTGQLARILAYAEQVQQVDTTGVPPMSHPFADPEQQGREDETRPSLPLEAALANAPESDRSSGLFKVPRVLG